MNLPATPTAWHLAVKFLCEEQTKLQRLPVISGGVQPDTDQIILLCLQYASTGRWPTLISADGPSHYKNRAGARTNTGNEGVLDADGFGIKCLVCVGEMVMAHLVEVKPNLKGIIEGPGIRCE